MLIMHMVVVSLRNRLVRKSMIMSMIMMRVIVMAMIVMRAFAHLPHQRAALAPHQPRAQQRDAGVAGQLDKIGDFLHPRRRGVESKRQHAHDQHSNHSLQNRRHERNHEAAPQ